MEAPFENTGGAAMVPFSQRLGEEKVFSLYLFLFRLSSLSISLTVFLTTLLSIRILLSACLILLFLQSLFLLLFLLLSLSLSYSYISSFLLPLSLTVYPSFFVQFTLSLSFGITIKLEKYVVQLTSLLLGDSGHHSQTCVVAAYLQLFQFKCEAVGGFQRNIAE